MIIKLKLISYLFLCIASPLAMADLIVTQEEFDRYQNYTAPSKAEVDKSSIDGPKIVVFQPDLDKAIKSPFPIEIFFQPNEGKKISWKTFKVFYGNFQFDITSRFLKEARLTGNSVYIDKVDIPVGYHKLTIKISDEGNKSTQKDFLVLVEK